MISASLSPRPLRAFAILSSLPIAAAAFGQLLGGPELGMLEAHRNYSMGMLQLRNWGAFDRRIDAMIAQDRARRAEVRRREAAGRRVIAAGRATTRFSPGSPQTSLAVENMARHGSMPGHEAQFAGWLRKALAFYPQVVRLGNGEAKANLRPDDVADAATLCAVLSYAILTGRDDATPRQVAAVRDVSRRALLGNAHYQGYGPADRRVAGESFALFSVYLAALGDTVQKRSGAQRARAAKGLAKDAADAFRLCTGSTVQRLRLTDAGFKPR